MKRKRQPASQPPIATPTPEVVIKTTTIPAPPVTFPPASVITEPAALATPTAPRAGKTIGRPCLYQDRAHIVRKICAYLAEGIPMAWIAKKPGMPSGEVIRDWRFQDPAIDSQIAAAREDWFEVIAAQAIHLADLPEKTIENRIRDGYVEKIREDRKLQVETRLRLLAKWSPRRYSTGTSSGEDSPSTTTINLGVGLQFTLTEERRAELMAKKQQAIDRQRAEEEAAI